MVDASFSICFRCNQLSIHDLLAEVDLFKLRFAVFADVLSIHDLLAEVDTLLPTAPTLEELFQFTTASRRSTQKKWESANSYYLSIHDLLAEVDDVARLFL